MRVESEVTGVVCRIEAQPGQAIAAGATLLLVESMKMEIPICAERDGTVAEILVAEGEMVSDGQVVAVLR